MAKKRRDDPRQLGFLPEAPADERYDAQAELQKAYMPLKSELIPADEIQPVIDYINEGLQEDAMVKAGMVIPFPTRNQRQKKKKGMQSVFVDDLQIYAKGEYFEKPSPIGYEGLRSMADGTPILAAIVMTRSRQAARFCRPQEQRGGLGFEIRHRDRDHEVTDSERDKLNQITRFFSNCGWEWDPRKRKRLKRTNLSQFMMKMIRDSLTMDAAAIETEMKRDRGRGLDGFYAIDGATIRLCDEEGYEGDDELWAVQVVNGVVRTAYSYDHLIYEPRNPRTDVLLGGYGLAETELLIRVVTGFLNAMNLNIKGFTDNSIPRGILHLSGDFSSRDMAQFKRYWNSMVKGVNNAWALPVLVSKDQESKAQFESVSADFNEMYFSKWMTFLASVACAIYSMSPDEINFESFSAQKSSLSGEDTSEKLADSKDKGLRPLLSYFESLFSDYVLSSISDNYLFRFTGLDPEDKDKEHELNKSVSTVNEIRAQLGKDALEGDMAVIGEAPVNPALLGLYQQVTAPAPEEDPNAQVGMDFGQPDDEVDAEPLGQARDEEQDDNPDGPEGDDERDQGDFGIEQREGDFGKSTIYEL